MASKSPKKPVEQQLADVLNALRGENPEIYTLLQAALAGAGGDQKLQVNLTKEAEHEWDRQKKEPHFKLEIQMLQDDTEEYQYIGAAGVSYYIKKGEEVMVPQSVIDVLKSTKGTKWVEEIDEEYGRKRMKEVPYSRIPYNLFGSATPAEVATWKKNNASLTTKPGTRRARPAQEQAEA